MKVFKCIRVLLSQISRNLALSAKFLKFYLEMELEDL